jgi:hypothetical protein
MNDTQMIEERLHSFLAVPDDADWADVLSRAGKTPTSAVRPRSGKRLSRRVLIAGAAALLLLGVGSAIAAVTIASGDGTPVQFAPTTGSTPSLGSDPTAIIATIKSRVPDVLSIRITKDAISNASGKGTTDYLVAHVNIAAPADRGPEISRASWESDLVGGALFTGFTQANLAPPFGVDLTLVLPDGTRDQVGGGLGKVVPNQVFDSVTPEIQTRIAQNAGAQGLRNVRVTTFQVVNDVIEIHAATTAAPAKAASNFYKAGGIDGLLGQSENHFEGVYFQLDNAQGNPILIQTTAPRAGAGGYWAAPSTGIQGDQIRVPHH